MSGFLEKTGMLLISMFIIVILYFVISSFTTSFFDTMLGADMGAANSERDLYIPHISTALNIGFAVALATPAILFIMRIFEREPDWSYNRRFYR